MTRAFGRLAIILTLALVVTSGIAQADTFKFKPTPSDLGDLDHTLAYQWGVTGFVLPTGHEVVSATLKYDDIYNWQNERFYLYTRLFDTWVNVPPPYATDNTYANGRVTTYRDNEGAGDYFSGYGGVSFGPWTGTLGGPGNAIDLTYNITDPTALSWLGDGSFAFGIDPDCHFYNHYVQLQIETAPTTVPEPASLLLLGAGLIGMGRTLRRRMR